GAEIDLYTASAPVEELRLRVWVHSAELAAVTAAPALCAVSASDDDPEGGAAAAGPVALQVPALTQMGTPGAIRHRICSPTSVAMVLGYWERPAAPLDLAREMFDPRHDLYGVWPAAIRAAARRGVWGYLLRFPSWAAAAWCLAEGVPIVASVRYGEAEVGRAVRGDRSCARPLPCPSSNPALDTPAPVRCSFILPSCYGAGRTRVCTSTQFLTQYRPGSIVAQTRTGPRGDSTAIVPRGSAFRMRPRTAA